MLNIYKKIMGIYQVQTNPFVQTVQTSIWTTGLTSMWLGRAVKCKITQSPTPLGCWSGGSDWSLHDLHEKIGLHMIYSQFKMVTMCI